MNNSNLEIYFSKT